MIGILLSLAAMVVIGLLLPALASDKPQTYGSKLEEYIVSHHPKDTYDVERLTREFDEKQKQGLI